MKAENVTEIETDAVHTTLGAIFMSLELSRSSWLVTSLLPCNGEKMSKRVVKAGDTAGLFDLIRQLKATVRRRTGRDVPVIAIQEAGLDGFWIHRILDCDGIESHVVDEASIATSRRKRRAKTDKLDGETLLRALLAYKRGEPRVCAMVVPPSPEQEDRKRNSRERRALIAERIKIVNRVKGLLFSQGIVGFEPLKRDRRSRLEELRTGDGRELPSNLKAEIVRALDRIELVLRQIKDVEAARDEVARDECDPSKVANGMSMLKQLRGVGADFARGALVRGSVSRICESKAACLLCRSDADTVAKRIDQPGTGRIESGQSEAEDRDGAIVVVLAFASTSIGFSTMVPGAGRARRWQAPEAGHYCAREKTSDRAMEVCSSWCCH